MNIKNRLIPGRAPLSGRAAPTNGINRFNDGAPGPSSLRCDAVAPKPKAEELRSARGRFDPILLSPPGSKRNCSTMILPIRTSSRSRSPLIGEISWQI